MNKFPYKGYGRIICRNAVEAKRVEEIIKEMDEYEWEYYLPSKLITYEQPKLFTRENGSQFYIIKLEYTHKFDDIDLNELQFRCFLEDIPIVVWNTNDDFGEKDSVFVEKR